MIATYDAVTCNCMSGVGKFLSVRFILGTPKFKLTSKCTNSLKQAISEDSWLSRRQHLAPFFDSMIDTQLLKKKLKKQLKKSGSVNTISPANANKHSSQNEIYNSFL